MATLYSAPAVLPGDGRCLADAGVLVDGERVAAVGHAAELVARASRRHHVEGALLPAMAEAASVVELSDAADSRGDLAPDPAGAVARPAGQEGAASQWSDDRRRRSARRGAGLLLRGGVGLAVDHVRWGVAVPALTRTRLPGDSLVDVGAVSAGEGDDVAAALRARLARRVRGRRLGVAVAAPPQDSDVGGFSAVVRAAAGSPLRVTTRPGVAVDTEALAHAGALRPGVSVGPNPALAPADAQRLARAGVSVLVVPRSSDPPDLAALAGAGAGVVLGGGLTAAPDPLADAAAFAALADEAGLAGWPATGTSGPGTGGSAGPGPPGTGASEGGVPGASAPAAGAAAHPEPESVPARAALALVTAAGAARLGWGETAGLLAPGRRADLVAVEDPGAATGHPEAVLAAAGCQVLTVLAGVQRARRASADVAWPPVDRQAWRDEPG